MRAAIIAFSMYSRIPMPMFEWKEEDMKYAMCFFPAIGMVIGAVFYGMFLLLSWLLPGSFLAAGILLAVPIFITGGIHMDGFMDTCDARASYGDREKKLAILKDTHTGAFAVIFGALYLILYAAACMELDRETAVLVSIGFVISRSLSGLSTVTFPEARKHGMLADFMKDAKRKKKKMPGCRRRGRAGRARNPALGGCPSNGRKSRFSGSTRRRRPGGRRKGSSCRARAKPCSRPFKGRSGKSRGSSGKIRESWSSCSLRQQFWNFFWVAELGESFYQHRS